MIVLPGDDPVEDTHHSTPNASRPIRKPWPWSTRAYCATPPPPITASVPGGKRGERGQVAPHDHRIAAAECHRAGLQRPRGRDHLLNRKVGTQVVDAPAVLPNDRERGEEPPLVPLAGQTRPYGQRPR